MTVDPIRSEMRIIDGQLVVVKIYPYIEIPQDEVNRDTLLHGSQKPKRRPGGSR